ncbi:MAG: aldo/keto reductase [Deltaproteobacteria bacterium]|nr:aldo/keto reductase [Deltaproteobacteria bacterium]
MEYRQLGRSGVKVSSLCLGAMTFGEADDQSFMHQVSASEGVSFEIMDRAREAGINFIDVADVYGQDGLAEKVVGKWLADRSARDETVLATKFRFRMGEGPNGTGASRRYIKRAIEGSLRRLGTDHVDLYQIHMQDIETPEEETLRALDDLVREGKVLYLGCSNYAAYRLVESLDLAGTHGWSPYVTLQAQYSLVHRGLEREHVPLCRHHGLGILPWSPLASGFLSGKYRKGEVAPAGSRLEKWAKRYESFDDERNWKIIDALREVAGETEHSPAQVALAWLLHQDTVSSVIVGARTVEQLEDNLGAVDLELSDEQLGRLEEASDFELGYPYEMLKRVQGSW